MSMVLRADREGEYQSGGRLKLSLLLMLQTVLTAKLVLIAAALAWAAATV
jgi:hypothetical protein